MMSSTDSNDDSYTETAENFSAVPKNVGHLMDTPIEFICPACNQLNTSRVEHEAVTVLQRIACSINVLLCCKPIRWQGRHDVNHYCGKCGCFIGRQITLSWYKRALFRMQRCEVEEENRFHLFRKVQKEELDEKKLKKQRDALARA